MDKTFLKYKRSIVLIMLSLKKSKKDIPDLTEFTDEQGRKWIQTSVDDLFSANELNDIIEKLQKDKAPDEVVLARFDFQKVNKEYYETVLDLQARLRKQNEILRQLLINASDTIDKKNKKLKELVKYIRELHLLLAYYKVKPEEIEQLLPSPDAIIYEPMRIPEKEEAAPEDETPEKISIGYTEVEEILLNEQGEEKGPVEKKT
jgi:hypothetical protein